MVKQLDLFAQDDRPKISKKDKPVVNMVPDSDIPIKTYKDVHQITSKYSSRFMWVTSSIYPKVALTVLQARYGWSTEKIAKLLKTGDIVVAKGGVTYSTWISKSLKLK